MGVKNGTVNFRSIFLGQELMSLELKEKLREAINFLDDNRIGEDSDDDAQATIDFAVNVAINLQMFMMMIVVMTYGRIRLVKATLERYPKCKIMILAAMVVFWFVPILLACFGCRLEIVEEDLEGQRGLTHGGQNGSPDGPRRDRDGNERPPNRRLILPDFDGNAQKERIDKFLANRQSCKAKYDLNKRSGTKTLMNLPKPPKVTRLVGDDEHDNSSLGTLPPSMENMTFDPLKYTVHVPKNSCFKPRLDQKSLPFSIFGYYSSKKGKIGFGRKGFYILDALIRPNRVARPLVSLANYCRKFLALLIFQNKPLTGTNIPDDFDLEAESEALLSVNPSWNKHFVLGASANYHEDCVLCTEAKRRGVAPPNYIDLPWFAYGKEEVGDEPRSNFGADGEIVIPPVSTGTSNILPTNNGGRSRTSSSITLTPSDASNNETSESSFPSDDQEDENSETGANVLLSKNEKRNKEEVKKESEKESKQPTIQNATEVEESLNKKRKLEEELEIDQNIRDHSLNEE